MILAAVVVNQPLAFFAQWFVARALPQIFRLNVVAGIAGRANVMVGLLDRVPRRLPHDVQLLLGSVKSLGQTAAAKCLFRITEMSVFYHYPSETISPFSCLEFA
jgi:hypothetical protein